MDRTHSLFFREEAIQEAPPLSSNASTNSSPQFLDMITPQLLDRPPPASRQQLLYTTTSNHPPSSSSLASYLHGMEQPHFTTPPSQPPNGWPPTTSSPPILLQGVAQLSLNDRITHCTALLTSLETRITSQEAAIQSLHHDSMAKWLTFEEDRLRLKTQRGPQFKLEVHCMGIQATKIKIRKAEDQLAQCFRERWVLTAELAALERQEKAALLTGKG